MKKEYISPAMDVVLMKTEMHLLAGSGEQGANVYTEDASNSYETLSREDAIYW